MTKKTKKQSTTKSLGTFPINKNKSFQANFTNYLKVLRSKLSGMPAKEYIKLMHQYIEQCSKKLKNIPKKVVIKSTSQLKICKVCEQFIFKKKQEVQCGQCEDFYHHECLDSSDVLSIYEEFEVCQSCYELNRKRSLKNMDPIEIIGRASNEKEICVSCKKVLDESSTIPINKCLKCSKKYHK